MIPLLSVQDLSIGFRREGIYVKAIDQVGFSLNAGQTIGIVGESGSGKSVTSLAIMGLLPAVQSKILQGEVMFTPAGQNTISLLHQSEQSFRRIRGKQISMIFQEPMTSLNPVHTCGAQVAEVLQLHMGMSRQEARLRTIELFEKVQLPRPASMFDVYPHQISGGQKQRVMIAMAIACEPLLLIADEPTTALDVTVQKSILHLLKDLQQENGMGMIFISHDLGVVAQMADEVAVMYKGSLIEKGPSQHVLKHPHQAYTKGLMACKPPVTYKPERLLTVKDFMAGNTGNIEVVTDEQEKAAQVKLFAQEPILRLSHIQIHYPGKKNFFGRTIEEVKALDDISLDVYPGETLGLVGESGCGKTTLGRTIMRLIEVSGGQIAYKGRDILALSHAEMRAMRQDIQIIFQDPYSSLNPRMTIGQALIEPMQVHRIGKNDEERQQKAIMLLKRVGLEEEHLNRYPHEFSGGQRQRICIARALAMNPKFIICDESVSALDVSVQAQVLNLLNELKKEFGLTYIFISHDLSVVKYMSDRMVVMNKGKIVETGLASEVYKNPQQTYTQKLIAAMPKEL